MNLARPTKTQPGATTASRFLRAAVVAFAFICVHLCPSVVKASLLTLSLTNQFGLPDTNAIRVVQASTNTPVLADGSVVTIGLPVRVNPDTNGTVRIFRLIGNYVLYGPTLGRGIVYRFPDNYSNATAYPLSGFNTFETVTVNGITTNTIIVTNFSYTYSTNFVNQTNFSYVTNFYYTTNTTYVTNTAGMTGLTNNQTTPVTFNDTLAVNDTISGGNGSTSGVLRLWDASNGEYNTITSGGGYFTFGGVNFSGIGLLNATTFTGGGGFLTGLNAAQVTGSHLLPPDVLPLTVVTGVVGTASGPPGITANMLTVPTNGVFFTFVPTNQPPGFLLTNLVTMTVLYGTNDALRADQLTAAGVVTNDISLNNYFTLNNSTPAQRFYMSGCIGELQSAGIRGAMVDLWPFTSSVTNLFGTNQISFMGNSYIGWNQSTSGQFTNLYSSTATTRACTNVINLPDFSGQWTIGMALSMPLINNNTPSSSSPNSQRGLEFVLCNTNNTDFLSFNYLNNSTEGVFIKQGTNLVSYGFGVTGSNVMQLPTDKGFHTRVQHLMYRHALVLSFDGTNLWGWWNGEPAAWNVGNSQSTLNQKYRLPISLATNSWNQICLGYNANWATNWPAGFPGSGFNGNIYSMVIFTNLSGSNTVSPSGKVSVWSGATAITKALRWLEPSKRKVSIDGTSMLSQDYAVGVNITNETWMEWASRHPEVPDIQITARAGSSLQSMTNQSSAGPIFGEKLTDVSAWEFTFNRFNCDPYWVQQEEIIDHPRNDNALTIPQLFSLFNRFMFPLKSQGVKIRYYVANVDQTAQVEMKTVFTAMRTNTIIDQYLDFAKYANSNGIISMTNTALTSAAHWNGSDQNLADYVVKQTANLWDGLPITPPTTGTGIVAQYPTYFVTLSGTTASFTNVFMTPVITTWSGGTVTGISLYGLATLLSTNGDHTILQPWEWIQFTNSGVPSFSYQPIP